jgi:hypothetical protein
MTNWIPGQARNDEVLVNSPGAGFGNARRIPRTLGFRFAATQPTALGFRFAATQPTALTRLTTGGQTVTVRPPQGAVVWVGAKRKFGGSLLPRVFCFFGRKTDFFMRQKHLIFGAKKT